MPQECFYKIDTKFSHIQIYFQSISTRKMKTCFHWKEQVVSNLCQKMAFHEQSLIIPTLFCKFIYSSKTNFIDGNVYISLHGRFQNNDSSFLYLRANHQLNDKLYIFISYHICKWHLLKRIFIEENRQDLSNAQINSLVPSCNIDESKIIKREDLLPMEIDNI